MTGEGLPLDRPTDEERVPLSLEDMRLVLPEVWRRMGAAEATVVAVRAQAESWSRMTWSPYMNPGVTLRRMLDAEPTTGFEASPMNTQPSEPLRPADAGEESR